jgi:hypothetical protein
MAIAYGRSNKLSAAGGNQFNDPRENHLLRNAPRPHRDEHRPRLPSGIFWRVIANSRRSITRPACIRLAKIALTGFSQKPGGPEMCIRRSWLTCIPSEMKPVDLF